MIANRKKIRLTFLANIKAGEDYFKVQFLIPRRKVWENYFFDAVWKRENAVRNVKFGFFGKFEVNKYSK